MLPKDRLAEEAERSVIGAALLRADAYARANLQPDDFTDLRHRAIWAAIGSLVRAGEPVDTLLIERALGDRAHAIGLTYIASCAKETLTADNVEHYAAQVASDARMRRLRTTVSDLVRRADLSEVELRSRIERALEQHQPAAPALQRQGVCARDFVTRIIAQSNLPLISTGLQSIDTVLGGGLRARMMHLIIAATGKGKTSLALQVAARHAEHAPVAYYSLEMTGEHLISRVIGQRVDASWAAVLSGQIAAAPMNAALEPIDMDVLTRETCPDPIASLNAAADEMLARGQGVPLIVVDYAQLVADLSTGDARLATMMAIRGLCALVETRDIVLLVLSQGNRPSAARMRDGNGANGKPAKAEDFVDVGAETSDLEKFAATVLVLGYASADGATMHEVTVYVAKQRLGGPCQLGLKYNGVNGRWEDLGRAAVPAAEREGEQNMARLIELIRKHPRRLTTDKITEKLKPMRKETARTLVKRAKADGALVQVRARIPREDGVIGTYNVWDIPNDADLDLDLDDDQ